MYIHTKNKNINNNAKNAIKKSDMNSIAKRSIKHNNTN